MDLVEEISKTKSSIKFAFGWVSRYFINIWITKILDKLSVIQHHQILTYIF